jgi:hypothetical protein
MTRRIPKSRFVWWSFFPSIVSVHFGLLSVCEHAQYNWAYQNPVLVAKPTIQELANADTQAAGASSPPP